MEKFQLAMRIQVKQSWKSITCPTDMAGIIQSILNKESIIDKNKEHFWTIGLNNNNLIQYIELVSLGILDYCIVHPREIFRLAIMKGVKSIVLVHNHPSGDLFISPEDKDITNRMIEAGKILMIKVFDHLIISEDRFVSFNQEGLIS